MKKKKINLFIIVIILLVGVYFAYKDFNLYYYDINIITDGNYQEFISGLKVENEITLKKVDVIDNNYLEYDGMKIRNDFKNFEQLEEIPNVSSLKFVLRDEKNKVKASFWMGKGYTYLTMLKADKTLFGTNDKKITNTDISEFLKENNINNDIELLKYLEKNKNKKNSIFTSVKQMKKNYGIQFLASIMLPKADNITLIKGDYEGYIFNMENMKEVSLLKDGKRYVFMFINTDYFTDEYVKDILNTLVI